MAKRIVQVSGTTRQRVAQDEGLYMGAKRSGPDATTGNEERYAREALTTAQKRELASRPTFRVAVALALAFEATLQPAATDTLAGEWKWQGDHGIVTYNASRQQARLYVDNALFAVGGSPDFDVMTNVFDAWEPDVVSKIVHALALAAHIRPDAPLDGGLVQWEELDNEPEGRSGSPGGSR